VFAIALCSPIVALDVGGVQSTATLPGAVAVLWAQQMPVVAVIVLLFTCAFPALQLGALLYVILGLRMGYRPPGFHRLLRAVRAARHWAMIEVLMVGILITVIKMTSLARVSMEPGLYAFAVLTVLLAVVFAYEPHLLWNLGDDLAPPAAPPVLPAGAATLACHACGLVAADEGAAHPCCARCGKALRRGGPASGSVGRTWALLLAAAILYVPANLLPVMYTHSLFGREDDTIISGVLFFWSSGSAGLAAIIFIASIVVPVLKLAVLSLLALTAQRRSLWRPQQRVLLYRMVELVGRWSMLDIFVITLTVGLVRFESLATITAGPGALAFCAVVVLTMLASQQFDPHLIWDPDEAAR
jgi:paraquat-inducible protein A